jgi:hypothetical protein
MLLLGYVIIIHVIVLLFLTSLYSINGEIAFNVFSAIVFIVAGPAVGYSPLLSLLLKE